MASHTISTTSANLHGDMVDVEFLAVRGCDGKLHILVGRVILCFYPGTTVAGADHQPILPVVTILCHAIYFGIGGSRVTIDNGIVITGQCPCGGEGLAST